MSVLRGRVELLRYGIHRHFRLQENGRKVIKAWLPASSRVGPITEKFPCFYRLLALSALASGQEASRPPARAHPHSLSKLGCYRGSWGAYELRKRRETIRASSSSLSSLKPISFALLCILSQSTMSSTQSNDTEAKAEPAPYQAKEIFADQDEEQAV